MIVNTLQPPVPDVPPKTQAVIDKLIRQAVAAEDRGALNYASQKRSQARTMYANLGFLPHHLPESVAERPRGNNALDYEARSVLARQAEAYIKETEQKAALDFINKERDWREAIENDLILWHREHAAAFMDWLNEYPSFYSLPLWCALSRVAAAWAEHSGGVPPCPLPPARGRGDFLASFPPGTKDWSRQHFDNRILEDDLTF